MKAFISKVANAAKEYSGFRDHNASVLASASDRFEKGVVVAAGALNAVAAATISVATVSAAKQANGLLAKSGKYIAGIYLCEYFAVGIESAAVLTIEIRRDIKARREAARAARDAEILELLDKAEDHWKEIATTGGNLLDAIAEQPIGWLRPLSDEQVAAYEERERAAED